MSVCLSDCFLIIIFCIVALHLAALNNQSKVVRILLDNGCDSNIKDNVRHVDVNALVSIEIDTLPV